ncbi:hypothetical protein BSN85_16405 [Bradyrhizobium brasilense]|uniref:hypothetical protein n=1 Tax=Bradyrhizobium brasilense TaxID=1419277 RepID=UPI0009762585|nr:hypothetical protein [Bradyrhizobium brasilense]OMI09508.1 hypothetical protein BSN85_16405 [Bradyrhizobium brasilense]
MDQARTLYEELVAVRNRLADLPPLTSQDFEDVGQAMHEVVWLLMTPPPKAKAGIALDDQLKGKLIEAARNRDLDIYISVVALVARKLGLRGRTGTLKIDQLGAIGEAFDALTFDYVAPKKATLATLRQLRSDLDARIAYVTAFRPKGYQFQERPELYAERADKAERPDKFFRRVYGDHARRGLTQADVRGIDPAYYNVLHVWCTRHKRKLSSFLAPSRQSRDR